MHPMDITLQQSFPTVMVPRFGDLAPLETTGERLLIAANGVFLEVSRPWLRLVRRVAQFDVKTAVPYGPAAETTDLRCGKLPAHLIGQFARWRVRACPTRPAAGSSGIRLPAHSGWCRSRSCRTGTAICSTTGRRWPTARCWWWTAIRTATFRRTSHSPTTRTTSMT